MSAPADRVGQVIAGRYRVRSALGAGGMATAWLAVDLRVGREVVVKIPHENLLADPDFRRRFEREIRSLARLQHPGVLPLHDSGEEDGVPYCVVRYLRGGDLADRIDAAGGRLGAGHVARWLPDLADTLDFIHARGVLHRDVSPVNILFDEGDTAFLSDFGVAAILKAADTGREGTRLTAEGSFVGAALYSPPEAVSRELTPAYDQYSLGLVLYQALCGRLPFPQVDARALMLAKNSGAPPPLGEQGVAIPPAACGAVMRALSLQPEDRFPSCRDFAEAFVGDDGERVVTREIQLPGVPSRVRRRARRRRLAGALFLAVAAAVGVLFGRDLVRDGERAPGPPAADGVLAGRFRPGTTPAELDAALALCRSHGGACPRAQYADEILREVVVGPFTLDETEVTNEAFAAFARATGYRTTAERRGTSRDGPFEEPGLDWRRPAGPRSSHLDLPRHPVVHVSAEDAEAYCAHAGGRLPTEAEWELAARGQERRIFAWGESWDPDAASWARDESARLHPVGRFPPGPFGHLDLTGNVWEWTGTHEGRDRVLKGGSWLETNPANLRAAARLHAPPSDTSSDIGFRCAVDAAQ